MADKPTTSGKPYWGGLLSGEKATGIPVLDAMAYGRWPHLFSYLALKHEVPDHFLITLLYLWDGTMGSAHAPNGNVALAQIPVREREARKWLAAFCAVGFFEKDAAEWGDRKGSMFTYNEDTRPQEWEKLFAWAGAVKNLRNWDKVGPERFANTARRALGLPVASDERWVPEPSEEGRRAALKLAKGTQR